MTGTFGLAFVQCTCAVSQIWNTSVKSFGIAASIMAEQEFEEDSDEVWASDEDNFLSSIESAIGGPAQPTIQCHNKPHIQRLPKNPHTRCI